MSATGAFDVVGSEIKFSGRIVEVRVDQVVMPGGAVAAREVVKHHRAVAVVALDDDDQVVLIAQYRHPLRRRIWELPAGLLDVAGELPRLAAARELAEETGLAAAEWSLLVDLAASPGITDEAVRVFLARGLSEVGRPELADDEESDLTVHRVPLAAAVAAALRGEIVNASTVGGLLAAQLAVQNGGALRPADLPWTDGPALARTDDEPLRPLAALS